MIRLAKIISWICIPLLTPIYALLIALYIPTVDKDFLQRNVLCEHPSNVKVAILCIFGLFCVMAPSVVIVFMRMQRMVSSVMLDNRRERYVPAVATIVSGLGLIYTVYTKAGPSISGYYFLLGLALGSFFTVVICTLITFWYKISLHAAGMGILCGFVLAYYSEMRFFPMIVVISVFLISGVVMSMRMLLKKHDLRQSLYGYAVGFAITLCTCTWLLDYVD